MKSDLEIAQSAHLEKIEDVAKKINITQDALINFGPYMAKINSKELDHKEKKKAKLILVTAMSPTPAGEGKTTTTIGLTDALASQGKSVVACLREPSLGPVFGMKGGATGGGILKQYQWRILTYISLVISMRLPQQTISLLP